jgi:hypothetical protein
LPYWVWGKTMYLENVRTQLAALDEPKIYEIAVTTRDLLVEAKKINKSKRPAEVSETIENFIEEKDISNLYLDGILLALDELYPEGGKRALLGEHLDGRQTWRNLLIRVTKDIPAPLLEKYIDDPHIIQELKRLFITLSKKCITDDKDETLYMLKVLNRIFITDK